MSFNETILVLAFGGSSLDGDVFISEKVADSTSNDFLVKVGPDCFWRNTKLKKEGLEGCQDGFLGECFERLDDVCTCCLVNEEDTVINATVGSYWTKTDVAMDNIAVVFAWGGWFFSHPRRFDGCCFARIKA